MKVKKKDLWTIPFSILFLLVVFKGTEKGSLLIFAYAMECVGVMAVIAITGYCMNKKWFHFTVDLWPALYVVVLLVYILYGYFMYTYSKTSTSTFIYRYIIFIPIMLFVLNVKDTVRLFQWSEKWILLIAGVFCLQYPFSGINGSFLGSYQNVAAALSIGLTIMLVDLFTREKVRRKDIVLILFVTLALLMTGKRTFTIIPYGILFFFYLKGCTPERRRRILRILLPILVAIPVVVFLKPDLLLMVTRMFDSDGNISLTGRQHYWELAAALWRDNFVHGIGIGTYSTYIVENSQMVLSQFGVQHVYSTHNIYLQLLAEGGIVGFALWVLFFICGIISSYKMLGKVKQKQKPVYIDLCSKALALQLWFVLYGFTGNPLTSVNHMYLFLFATMITQSIKSELRSETVE